MAAGLGASALADVHSEGLDELLHDLANVCPIDGEDRPQTFGVPALDSLLEVFMLRATGPADARHQQLAREPNPDDDEMLLHEDDIVFGQMPAEPDSPSNPVLSGFARRSKRPAPVVELSSSLSGAGKSQLLYYLIAHAILPRSYGETHIGGKEAAVVFIDADDRFDADRLLMVTRAVLQRCSLRSGQTTGSALSNEDTQALLLSSMKYVHVFRPHSSSSLLATLSTLDTYLYDGSQHYSFSRPLQMIVVDSATAFIWQDRLRDEVARTEDIGRSREEIDRERELKQSFYLADLYGDMVKELKRLQARFGCTVLYTTLSGGRPPSPNVAASGPFGPYDRTSSRLPSLRPPLSAPWGTYPILRLIVHRDAIRSFPPGMSAHDARNEAGMRQSIVRQGKFSAWVNGWDREEWPRRVVDGIDAHNGGSFSFYVRDSGIEIPLPDQ
ncbi:hypothetical protein N7492_006727 [Penicillium capsulatum]|uniref:DNA recombination and repair protein Rad51-like C-terminal domain-containing protein n=1 Tax=Penicillium capsulatum TaxID=69766 RepID=A0A9W9I3G8_9EURO|nr:hypothetical protein N7492_006727 [Penicillium capsulatum]KAJ6116562.1 hypothetical protein N7512_006287 [Penicillium capsulatum]